MKRSYFLSIYLFFSINSVITAQSKNYIGVGASIDFNKSIASTSSDAGLQPIDTDFSTISLHSFLNLNSDKLVQLRINTRVNSKTIGFASDELIDFGGIMIDRYQNRFLSLDMGITGLYAIPLNENKLLPAFGVFGSYNLSTRGLSVGRQDGSLTSQEFSNEIPQRTNKPMVAYLGFNAGLVYQTTINGYPIEFYGMIYFSGVDSFEATYKYETVDELSYKGRNRTIALGFNIPIIRKRNQAEKAE